MDHLSLEQLEDYARTTTNPEHLAALEEHLLICEPCRTALQEVEEESRVIRRALIEHEEPTD
jgi:predicted anti-sigma-YlaC factor YlaD